MLIVQEISCLLKPRDPANELSAMANPPFPAIRFTAFRSPTADLPRLRSMLIGYSNIT